MIPPDVPPEAIATGPPSAPTSAVAPPSPPPAPAALPSTPLSWRLAIGIAIGVVGGGFANFSSVGIQLGGIGAMAPERRHDLARLGGQALFVGFVATILNAAIAGVLL